MAMDVVRRVSVEDLPKQMKQAREADGRSVQVLATMAEISVAYWYQLENNKRSWVSEEVVRRIEKVLKTDFRVRFEDERY